VNTNISNKDSIVVIVTFLITMAAVISSGIIVLYHGYGIKPVSWFWVSIGPFMSWFSVLVGFSRIANIARGYQNEHS